MKFLPLHLVLATTFGLASLSTFANESVEIPAEVLEQLPHVETIAEPSTTTSPPSAPTTDQGSSEAEDQKTTESNTEQPEVIPADAP